MIPVSDIVLLKSSATAKSKQLGFPLINYYCLLKRVFESNKNEIIS